MLTGGEDDVTPGQKAAVEVAYEEGDDIQEIAASAGVTTAQADAYLQEWCGQGCPGAFAEGDK